VLFRSTLKRKIAGPSLEYDHSVKSDLLGVCK